MQYKFFVVIIHSFVLLTLASHHVQSSPREIDVICTSNKNHTGDCRSNNNDDDPFIPLTCTQVSSSIIECSKDDPGQHSRYNCMKTLSISKYQKLFTCQLDLTSTKIDAKQFHEDEINSKMLDLEINDIAEKFDSVDLDVKSAASSYLDALNMDLNDLEFNTDEVEAQNSYTFGY
jgi:predicted lipase